jgi:putative ABC transport system permease protein
VRGYFVVLFRNLTRDRLYTAINILGLALGLASCLILGLFLKSELTYDRHYAGYEHIYRIENEFTVSGKTEKLAITSDALGPMIAAEYPDRIKAFVRLRDNTSNGGISMRRVDQPENVYYWENSYFVDDNVFDVLPVKIIAGDPKTALKEGDTVAISESVARKYFGNENPIGKSLASDSGNANRITLVFADLPVNTHLKYDLLWSFNRTFLKLNDNPTARRAQLTGPQARTYTLLVMDPAFKMSEWARMSDDFYKKYIEELLKTATATWSSWLQPMKDMHLNAEVSYDKPTGNKAYIFGCAAVALIILAIACINYMNLATARATRRARSVGFRKILGASRLSLALQFLGESLFFSILALIAAVLIVMAVLKFTPINTLMDGKVGLDLLHDPTLALWLVGAALCIGLLSGLYPAFYLSSWAPLTALAGRQPAGKGSLRMREFLVLVQFTISAAAIAVTLLMVAQMHYVSSLPLGFERDNRLMVSVRGAGTIEKIQSIRNALLADSRIHGVAVAQQTPADGDTASIGLIQIENNEGAIDRQIINVLAIGDDYEKVLGLKVARQRGAGQENGLGKPHRQARAGRARGWRAEELQLQVAEVPDRTAGDPPREQRHVRRAGDQQAVPAAAPDPGCHGRPGRWRSVFRREGDAGRRSGAPLRIPISRRSPGWAVQGRDLADQADGHLRGHQHPHCVHGPVRPRGIHHRAA